MRHKTYTEEILRKFFSSQRAMKALIKGSGGNKRLAEKRLNEYKRMIGHIASYYSNMSYFSANMGTGLSHFPHLGTTVSVAALMAMVRSVAGFVTLEKAIDQPNHTFYFADLVSVTSRQTRYPVVGAPTYDGNIMNPFRVNKSISSINTSTAVAIPSTISIGPGVTATLTDLNVDTNTLANVTAPSILPRSFKALIRCYPTYTSPATPPPPVEYLLQDDGSGSFLVPSSMIGTAALLAFASGSINYGNNTATLPFSATINLGGTGSFYKIEVEYSWAYAGAEQVTYPIPGNETRLKLDMTRVVTVNTKPDTRVAEIDLFTIDTMRKTMNADIIEILTNRISEILIDTMNRYIARVYVSNVLPKKGILEIDVSTPVGDPTLTISSYNSYNPIVDKIMGELETVNHKLAKDSFIGLTANAYLVSSRMAYWLARTSIVDNAFVREDSRYINGLIGYYRGVPVIVNTLLDDIFDGTKPYGTSPNNFNLHTAGGFAIHNIAERDLSPAVYATFLPITATPTVGNFDNPVQQVLGLYHMSDVAPLAHELAVPFRFVGLPPSSVV